MSDTNNSMRYNVGKSGEKEKMRIFQDEIKLRFKKKLRRMWPVVMLAVIRSVNVIGRIILLINSIMVRKIINVNGVCFGIM
jgi:hypothetical protein